MRKKTLETIPGSVFPFNWVNLANYRESEALRKELYLPDHSNNCQDMIVLFYDLFGDAKEDLVIYNGSWWDFCLDTWNIQEDSYDYNLNGKTELTKAYLGMLEESDIEIGFEGLCVCNEWDRFLTIVVSCILSHNALYSPLFCNTSEQYFFYFHHTASLGLYYSEETLSIRNVLKKTATDCELK